MFRYLTPKRAINTHRLACLGALTCLLYSIGLAQLEGAIVITGDDLGTPITVNYEDYVKTGEYRGEISSTGSYTNFINGYYSYPTGNAIITTSSTSSQPTFALTLTNNTGATITKLDFSGVIYQFRDSMSDSVDTHYAVVSGLTIPSKEVLYFTVISNFPDEASTVNNPALTAPYSATLDNIEFLSGASFTITWMNLDDLGIDAFYGLGGLTVTPTAVPEPSAALLVLAGVTGGFAALRRRRRRC